MVSLIAMKDPGKLLKDSALPNTQRNHVSKELDLCCFI